ncbi:hypothetical protein PTSG_11450 [Salpingoeca rosetta]|uniref:Uncharacterized protein n=1 Tax=Salpingoeca rosetta (strain ATCC 50818 / BSB-021) TaxID=946362 RepID=F2UTH2_SALR5|nr:uncharacterized protein PTSG_11450 [Salpingoeca rosetta]EGD83279.1 hypothetical protein PTSG_11450 [Salpingoeca rosetta]|eukprot:XP_004987535.1 hypothetical protein PTSG_11450 [Salpingoeca rosetta]
MRLPFGALALMLAMGYIAVDLNFDALANTEPAKSMTYYHVQHHTPPPASLIIPAAILVALLDTLYSLLVVRDARELLFLVLGSYVLYLFIGIVKPSMETMSGASLDDVDEYIPQLEAIRDAHLYMCPTVAAMLLCTVYTHMISPPSSSSSSSASSKHKKKHK